MKHLVNGRRFGRLLVLSETRDAKARVPCLCDCGTKHLAKVGGLINGRIVSCGCKKREKLHNTLDDILRKADKRGPDECWHWTGGKRNHGYGCLNFRGVEMLATRAIMTAMHGPIPKGLIVCHKCDNPPCVNPAHLFVGTYQDNVLDMIQKGRARPNGGKGDLHTYCRAGLHLMAESEYIAPKTGKRLCGVCMRERQNAWRRAKHAKSRAAPTTGDRV